MFEWIKRFISKIIGWIYPKPERVDLFPNIVVESAEPEIKLEPEEDIDSVPVINREEWMAKSKLNIDIDADHLYGIKLDRRKTKTGMVQDLIDALNK